MSFEDVEAAGWELLVVLDEMRAHLAKREPQRMERQGMKDLFSAADRFESLLESFYHEQRPPLSDPSVDSDGLVRSDSPQTSRDGAADVFPRSGTKRLAVLQALSRSGVEGATDDELCEMLSSSYSSVGPRRRELVAGGWVEDSGRTRLGSSGSHQTVWVLTERAEREIDAAVGAMR